MPKGLATRNGLLYVAIDASGFWPGVDTDVTSVEILEDKFRHSALAIMSLPEGEISINNAFRPDIFWGFSKTSSP